MSNYSALYVRLPNWIGDVCMSLPCLNLMLNTDVPVVVCARSWARDLLSAYQTAGFIEMSGRVREDRARVASYRKKARHAHARGLILPDSLSSALVFKFSGVPAAGYRDDGRSLLLRWPISKPRNEMHAAESWFHLTTQALERWKLPIMPAAIPATLGLETTPQHEEQALDAVLSAGMTPGGFILIAPTATGLHRGKIKVWPHFDALTRQLQEHGHTVAMCPPASEREAALKAAPTAICLPPLGLGGFATLTKLSALVICNDSGVSHLAAAVNARQLTLFGVTDQHRTGPWSPQATCLGSLGKWPTLTEVTEKTSRLITETVF
ncbi:MAG TPA: glycosyltransferase family 9 protein [Pusillimonas sp.]|uniref:glycosyltransferase family 9 protein n=1 Tax=unclassified Pusillimonas TaxID=2640016 RepID=UPI0026286FB7|nr:MULTISPECIES: glycosyltransferase family 9 protein [unclassified Pusillimonas]HLU20075.1 glycosyltransferase family 9 protein [Pusillimonas sp.]